MTNPPAPRKPRFLSSVPAPHIENARFGQPPAPPQIRTLGQPAPGAGQKGGVKSDAASDSPAQGRAPLASAAPLQSAGAPALPAHSGSAGAVQLGSPIVGTPTNPGAGNAKATTPPKDLPSSIPLELVRSQLAASIDGLRMQSEKLAEQARADTLEVAFQIARRIVEVEVRQSPEPLFALVRTSLGQLATARRITLRVSPQDIEFLRSARGKEATNTAALAELELSADASLEPGECLIESDLGQIDGRLTNRFAELRRHVDEASEGAA